MNYSLTWNLDNIFPNGSQSPELAAKLAEIKELLITYKETVKGWQAPADISGTEEIVDILKQTEVLQKAISQVAAFLECATAQNVHDTKADQLNGEVYSLISEFETVFTGFTIKLVQINESVWEELIKQPQIAEIAFYINEQRERGKEQLSEAEEALINALRVDGYVGWSTHYDTLVKMIEIPYTNDDGETVLLSAGQAFNKMHDDPDPEVRAELFKKWEKAWGGKAPLFADTINHLGGFRLANYKMHGVEDFMKEPLQYNRMKKETLDVMWDVIAKNKQPFVDFLNRKAKLLGKDKLSWVDVDAPIVTTEPKHYTFDEGAKFIIENFAKFGDELPKFAQDASENAWIEAEDRPGKRPGGFCTSFPETNESRIFMTYSGSPSGVATLAHELGHAFHSHVLNDKPYFNTEYAMNVAETASTFAEQICSDASVRAAKSNEEKITLLDTKILNAIAMFMNIHARFIFESNFYTERKNGLVSVERINEMMESAQKEAYQDALSEYHPTFWASKLHFYIAEVPFYNFPYTFGYLFSLGIYHLSLKEGKSFEKKYIALLQDTAAMTTEELAIKHLGVDLTKPDFWQAGVDLAIADVKEFLELTKE